MISNDRLAARYVLEANKYIEFLLVLCIMALGGWATALILIAVLLWQ